MYSTVVALGDSFSSLCGAHSSLPPPRDIESTWTDFASGLSGNLIYGNCSANRGWNYLNYLTDCASNAVDPLECPIRLVDLAYGGSAVEELRTGKKTLGPIKGLDRQITDWEIHVRPYLILKPAETLTVVWFGINDIENILNLEHSQGNLTDLQGGIDEHVKLITDALTNLHYNDGLHHFLILNIPSVLGFDPRARPLIDYWNDRLPLALRGWQMLQPSATVVQFDAHAFHQRLLSNATSYGLQNITHACVPSVPSEDVSRLCLDNSTFLSQDGVHLTSHVHRILADEIKHIPELGWNTRHGFSAPFKISGHMLIVALLGVLMGILLSTLVQLLGKRYWRPMQKQGGDDVQLESRRTGGWNAVPLEDEMS